MPGAPKKRKIFATLDERGGGEYLKEFLLSGGTLAALAKELDISRGFLHNVITKHEHYGKVVDQVRAEAADAHAEAGFAIIQELASKRKKEREEAEPGSKAADISNVDVSIAKTKIEQHKFIAAAWNQQRYNNGGAQTNISVNLGDMHLDALRKMKTVSPAPSKPIEHEPPANE